MRDAFGVPRDVIIHKAQKKPERTSGAPSAVLGISSVGAASAGKVMHDEHREVAAGYEKTARSAFKTGKKGLRRSYKEQYKGIKALDASHADKIASAGKNSGLKRMANDAHAENIADVKARGAAARPAYRNALKASVKNAKWAEAAHGNARKSAIIGAGVAAPLAVGALLTRPKKVSKAMTGYGDRALKALRGTQQGLKMVGEQKGMKLKPKIPSQREPVRGYNGPISDRSTHGMSSRKIDRV